MEMWIGIGLVIVLTIVFLWRSRRGGTGGKGRVSGKAALASIGA
jgi:hypothetical protein